MSGSSNDGSNKHTTDNDVSESANIYEDETSLIDLFLVLWKRKWFVLVGSIVPTLIIGLIIYFLPRDYTVTYTYDIKKQITNQITDQNTMDVSSWNLNKKNYNILLSRFYSKENLSRIINKLQQAGFNEYAGALSNARRQEELEELLKFEVLPPFINLTDIKEADLAKLGGLGLLDAQLLNITIITNSKEDIYKISSVIRKNFETITPMYLVVEQLNVAVNKFRTKMATLQENKFVLQLALEKNKNVLAKLKKIKPETSNKPGSDIRLQFDMGERSEYLPVEYQIQTAELRIIQLEETINENEKKYEYYKSLLSLNQKLLVGVENKALSHDTIQHFHSFLLESVKEFEKEELKEYLNSYIKKIENRIAANIPVTEKPTIDIIARGIVKTITIVFAVALMIAVFTSFLLEGLKNRLELLKKQI